LPVFGNVLLQIIEVGLYWRAMAKKKATSKKVAGKHRKKPGFSPSAFAKSAYGG